MVDKLNPIREYVERNVLATSFESSIIPKKKEQHFKHMIASGFENLLDLKDKHLGKAGLIMGHGPSLLRINKEQHKDSVKITCNDFHRITDIFNDSFKPDYWCGVNSFEALNVPFKIALESGIHTIVSVPLKTEFCDLLKIADDKKKFNLVSSWLWEQKVLQLLLSKKYNNPQLYTRGNTITTHMIALAMWMGCDPINITGFDMSYVAALEKYGMTHAGFTQHDDTHGTQPFQDPAQRNQILLDLRYLCRLAAINKIKINNLSSEENKLPKTLSYRGQNN